MSAQQLGQHIDLKDVCIPMSAKQKPKLRIKHKEELVSRGQATYEKVCQEDDKSLLKCWAEGASRGSQQTKFLLFSEKGIISSLNVKS